MGRTRTTIYSSTITTTEAVDVLTKLVAQQGFELGVLDSLRRGLIFARDTFFMEFDRQVTQVSQECVTARLKKVIELVELNV